ncbi:MAG: hypothetical protein WD066_04555 [Planctomycetaceae bacterium]
MPVPSDDQTPTRLGWIVSVLFWLCLLLAVGMYGAVALAPKYLDFLELRAAHHAGQVRLLALDRQTRTLSQVEKALESDPAFVAELARIDFDAAAPGEERIAVSPEHRLDAQPAASVETNAVAPLPWHAPLVRAFVENRGLRRTLLIASATIVLAAFALLHDSREGGRPLAWLIERYRREAKPPSP